MCGRIVVAVEKYEWIRVVTCGYISDKVDEKVDKSGWRIKIVADVGIPTQLSDKSGYPVEPLFPAAESGP